MKRELVEMLAKGQLAFASNMAAQKLHIVTLNYSAYESDVREANQLKKKADRDKAIAAVGAKRKEQWDAESLCGVTGSHAMYGRRTHYYWEVIEDPLLDNACKGCLREWKKLGEPKIIGYEPGGDPNAPWPWELPFGWREVLPEPKHPWDVPRGGDVELVKSDTGRTVGRIREEIRRFRRGSTIVRLTYHPESDTYGARHWNTSYEPQSDRSEVRGPLLSAREYCHRLMAQGGG